MPRVRKRRSRWAERRPPHPVRGACNCIACTEREQFHDAAMLHPDLTARVVATLFIGAIDGVVQGRCGAITLDQCFD